MQFNKVSLLVFALWVIPLLLIGFTLAYNSGTPAPAVSHPSSDVEQGPGSNLNADVLDGIDSNQVLARGIANGTVRYYDSGWFTLGNNSGITKNYGFNLGGNPDTYIIDLKCRSPFTGGAGPGLNNGMTTLGVPLIIWRNLTSTSIDIFRVNNGGQPCEQSTNNVRVIVYRID